MWTAFWRWQPFALNPSSLHHALPAALPACLLAGARLKITRNVLLFKKQQPGTAGGGGGGGGGAGGGGAGTEAGAGVGAGAGAGAGPWRSRPLVDIGLGFNVDLDRQRLEPVARIKVRSPCSADSMGQEGLGCGWC